MHTICLAGSTVWSGTPHCFLWNYYTMIYSIIISEIHEHLVTFFRYNK